MMQKQTKGATELRGKARIRAEIVEMSRALHKVGAVSDAELEKTTLPTPGRDAPPKVKPLSANEITALRERASVSQAVMAATTPTWR